MITRILALGAVLAICNSHFCGAAENQKTITREKDKEGKDVIIIRSGLYKLDALKGSVINADRKKAIENSHVWIIPNSGQAERAAMKAGVSDAIANKYQIGEKGKVAGPTVGFANNPKANAVNGIAIRTMEIVEKKGNEDFVVNVIAEHKTGEIERFQAELTRVGNAFVCDKHGEVESNAAKRKQMTQDKGCVFVVPISR